MGSLLKGTQMLRFLAVVVQSEMGVSKDQGP